MGKVKKLLKNISIFGISQFASKVLVFLLLPLYTSVLTKQEYGNADLVITTVSLLLPIVTLEISSSVLRYSMDDSLNAEKYLLRGFRIIAIGFIISLFFYPVLYLLNVFPGYLFLFYSLLLSQALYNLFGYYCRGIDKITIVGVAGIFSTLTIIGLNLLFLLVLKTGIVGYLLSYCIGYVLPTFFMLFVFLKRAILHGGEPAKPAVSDKVLLSYSLPLIPNNIAWWGVSSANKYLVGLFFGAEVLGLYSASLKVPSIIVTIQSIIAEGFAISIFEQFGKLQKDDPYYSNLYKAYNFVMVGISFIIICGHVLISKVLFSGDFFGADKYVPLLCISPIFGALSGYLGTFYSANKKNKGILLSTILGALVAIGTSLLFIGLLSIWAVVLGNIIGYFVIWVYRAIGARKIVNLKINFFLDIVSWLIVILSALINSANLPLLFVLILDVTIFLLLIIINWKNLKFLLLKILRKKERLIW